MIHFIGENHPNQISELVSFVRTHSGKLASLGRLALGEEFGDGTTPLVELDSISGPDKQLLCALKDSYFQAKVLLRESGRALVHLPMKGVLEFTRADGKTNCSYREYSYEHLHLRNFTRMEDIGDGFLKKVCGLYRQVTGESDGLSCGWVIDAGWWIAQQTGTMFTLTNQTRSGDPYWAIYDHYGPFYPLPLRVEENGVIGSSVKELRRFGHVEFALINEETAGQPSFRSPTEEEVKKELFSGLDPKYIIG